MVGPWHVEVHVMCSIPTSTAVGVCMGTHLHVNLRLTRKNSRRRALHLIVMHMMIQVAFLHVREQITLWPFAYQGNAKSLEDYSICSAIVL